MSTTDIIEAYEAGLITRDEAIEQGLVDNIEALYEKNTRPGSWAAGDRFQAIRGYAGR